MKKSPPTECSVHPVQTASLSARSMFPEKFIISGLTSPVRKASWYKGFGSFYGEPRITSSNRKLRKTIVATMPWFHQPPRGCIRVQIQGTLTHPMFSMASTIRASWKQNAVTQDPPYAQVHPPTHPTLCNHRLPWYSSERYPEKVAQCL